MRFKRCTRTGAAAAACLAMSFIVSGARAQETKEKVTIGDIDRTYLVRLPRGYDAKQKYPVVILLHGMNQDTDDMERLTRFAELADKDGIIAVYPSALHGRWNVGVRPPVQQPVMRSPGRGRRGGGGYPGGGGGYPGGGGGGYPGGGGGSGGGYPGGGQSGGQGRNDESRSEPADDVDFLNQMLDQMALKFSRRPDPYLRHRLVGRRPHGHESRMLHGRSHRSDRPGGCSHAQDDDLLALAPVGGGDDQRHLRPGGPLWRWHGAQSSRACHLC